MYKSVPSVVALHNRRKRMAPRYQKNPLIFNGIVGNLHTECYAGLPR